MNFFLFLLFFWLFALLFCWWRTRSKKSDQVITPPTPDELERALRSNMDDEEVLKLFARHDYFDIDIVRAMHAFTIQYRPHLFAKLQAVDNVRVVL